MIASLLAVMPLCGNSASANPDVSLRLSVEPLKCEIEIVHDGFRTNSYVTSGVCQEAVYRRYIELPVQTLHAYKTSPIGADKD